MASLCACVCVSAHIVPQHQQQQQHTAIQPVTMETPQCARCPWSGIGVFDSVAVLLCVRRIVMAFFVPHCLPTRIVRACVLACLLCFAPEPPGVESIADGDAEHNTRIAQLSTAPQSAAAAATVVRQRQRQPTYCGKHILCMRARRAAMCMCVNNYARSRDRVSRANGCGRYTTV